MTTPLPPATLQAPPAAAPVPPTFQAPPAAPQPVPPQQTAPAPEPLAAVASAALQAEAAPQFPLVTVQHGSQAYTIGAERDRWPLDVLEALEDGKMTVALRGLLGPKQWARFKATKPLTRDMGELWEAVGRAAGFDTAGE